LEDGSDSRLLINIIVVCRRKIDFPAKTHRESKGVSDRMLRQAAFIGKEKLLKGNVHCHTSRSDGRGTPEEVIRRYKEYEYDFLALTDHNIYNYENFAPETGILIIPGMEIDRNINGFRGVHCFHTVVLGHKENNPYQQDQRFVGGERLDGQADFQKVLDEHHAANQLTIYCHPEWSNTPAREFDQLKGNAAMEIWNSGCAIEDGLDTNAAYWDELLMQGQKIYGCATDDGHAMYQHCNGWIQVNAEKTVDSVLEAIANGAFYSSCGPEIKDFYVEDGVAVVECSACSEIVFRCGQYPCPRKYSENGDLVRAEFKMPEYLEYIRVTVMDNRGRRAWANPIFLK